MTQHAHQEAISRVIPTSRPTQSSDASETEPVWTAVISTDSPAWLRPLFSRLHGGSGRRRRPIVRPAAEAAAALREVVEKNPAGRPRVQARRLGEPRPATSFRERRPGPVPSPGRRRCPRTQRTPQITCTTGLPWLPGSMSQPAAPRVPRRSSVFLFWSQGTNHGVRATTLKLPRGRHRRKRQSGWLVKRLVRFPLTRSPRTATPRGAVGGVLLPFLPAVAARERLVGLDRSDGIGGRDVCGRIAKTPVSEA